ncbi:MAG: hypothetical protein WC297_01105 [Candidatus Paceibacterota bacterium]|jgi:DNA-directed RNA polymerase sigma subunit (sigma70/sigma32)
MSTKIDNAQLTLDLLKNLSKEELNQIMAQAELNFLEKRIVWLRIGLEDKIPRSFKEITKEIGLGMETIFKIEMKTLRKIRTSLISERNQNKDIEKN